MRALLLSLLLAPLAVAQPMAYDAAPSAGTMTPGADPAMLAFDVRASVAVPDAVADRGCTGFVDPSAPDAVVNWGGGDLEVWVRASFDPTMLVRTPSGEWLCEDDTLGLLPVVSLANAPAGRYAVWLGSFGPDVMEAGAMLYAGSPPPPPVLDRSAAPLAGEIRAQGGFEADQGVIEMMSEVGQSFDSAESLDLGDLRLDGYCNGFITASQPTAAVEYSAEGGTGTLALSAISGDFVDLVLLVVSPDGQVYCNDDYNGSDPVVVIGSPESGRYLLWAGTFSPQNDAASITLTVAESAEEIEYMDEFDDFDDFSMAPFSEGTYLPLDLDAMPALRLSVSTEAASASGSVQPEALNPVQGNACTGFIERVPTAGIELSGNGPFALTASSEMDLTLTVRTPSGQWYCSDDAYELDPGIQIDAPESGLYLAWVGTFGDTDMPTDVTVSAAPGELEVSGGFGGPVYDGPTQSDGMYDGTEILPGEAAVVLTLGGEAPMTETVRAGGPVLNPVDGDACQGFLSARPTATIESLYPEIEISASTNGDDLTLVVLAPDGSWTCSDDADGSNPRALVSGGTGDYSVWVGTFSRRTEALEATLEIDIPDAPPPPPAPEVIRG